MPPIKINDFTARKLTFGSHKQITIFKLTPVRFAVIMGLDVYVTFMEQPMTFAKHAAFALTVAVTLTTVNSASVAKAQATSAADTMDRATDTRAFVYSREGMLNPELFVSDTQGKATIAYDATQSYEEMEQIYRQGAYGITSGVMEGEFDGYVFTGTYYEPERYADLQTSC